MNIKSNAQTKICYPFSSFLIYVYNYKMITIYKYYYSFCEYKTYDADIIYNSYVNLALSYSYIL